VPRFDCPVVNNTRPQKIEDVKVAVGKFFAPILIRLLINVKFTPLSGDGCGKEDHGTMIHETIDKTIGAGTRNMFGDLKTLHDVEAAPEREFLREVADREIFLGDNESIRVDIVPVDTDRIKNAVSPPFR